MCLIFCDAGSDVDMDLTCGDAGDNGGMNNTRL